MPLSKIRQKSREREEWADRRQRALDARLLHREVFNIALMDVALGNTDEQIAARQRIPAAIEDAAKRIQWMMANARITIRSLVERNSDFREDFNTYAIAVKRLAPVSDEVLRATSFKEKVILVGKRIALARERFVFNVRESMLYEAFSEMIPPPPSFP